MDGNEESRKGTVSVFNGPSPTVRAFKSAEAEEKAIGGMDYRTASADGHRPDEIGVFVRSEAELDRARAAAKFAGASTTTVLIRQWRSGHAAVLPSAPCTSPKVSNSGRSR